MLRLILILSVLLVSAVAAVGESVRPPNIVFILIDDMGWTDLGCYGNTFHETPHLDQLAAEGVRFTDAYAAAPVCSPTRASILSGQYPARVGITDFIPGHWRPYEKVRVPINDPQHLALEHITLAEVLKSAGYVTGYFGKWHLGGREHFPDKHGFDEMGVQLGGGHFGTPMLPDAGLSSEDYLAEVLTDQASAFIEKHKEHPFFLYVSHYAVHIPLEAREALIEKYRQKEAPTKGVNNPIYAAMVEHVDDSVGGIMKALRDTGLDENTLVVFYSDNGGLYERFDKADGVIVSTNDPLRDEKGSLYEGGIRVPLIMRWPRGLPAGVESAVPANSPDIYPTLAYAAGAPLPEAQTLDGENLIPAIAKPGALKREALFWHYPHYHHAVPAGAIRSGDWKLLENYEDGSLELYNLSKDIGESKNLAQDKPKKARALQEKLEQWRAEVGAKMPTPNPDHDPDRAHEWGRHPDRQ